MLLTIAHGLLLPDGKFTISSLWEKLRNQFPKVEWSQLIWFSAHIPKCSTITWLAILNRLSTEDRLVMFGIKSASYCSLCGGSESHDHLFFNCPYSASVWQSLCTKRNVDWSPKSWRDWITFLSSFKGKSLRSIVIRLVLTVSVYHIWIERNVRKFQNKLCSVEVVVHKICSIVRSRLLSLTPLPQGPQANWYNTEWNLLQP